MERHSVGHLHEVFDHCVLLWPRLSQHKLVEAVVRQEAFGEEAGSCFNLSG